MLMIINVIIKYYKNIINSRVLYDMEFKSFFFVLFLMNIIIKWCLLSYEFLFWVLVLVSVYFFVFNMVFFWRCYLCFFLGIVLDKDIIDCCYYFFLFYLVK